MRLPPAFHSTDLIVALVMVASQVPLGIYLRQDLRPHISPRLWQLLVALLSLIWTVSGIGIMLDMLALHRPGYFWTWLRTVTVAVEISWGAVTIFGVLVYTLYRQYSRRAGANFSPQRRLALKTATTAAITAPVAIGGYGLFIERKEFHVKEVDLPVPNLHPDLANLRIVQISDLHVSAYLSVRDCARVVDMANELRPDLAALTGDIISDYGDPLEESIRELARLRATAGILGCHGNHEIYANCQNLATELGRKHGIQFLRKQAVNLKFGRGHLNVAGVDFQGFRSRPLYLPGAENLIVGSATNLLLAHSPDMFPAAVRKGYDAMLSGHTHAGQVTVEVLNRTLNIARFVTPFVAGLYRIDGRSLYVTAGIGTIGLPVRLGAPPEITLVRLKQA